MPPFVNRRELVAQPAFIIRRRVTRAEIAATLAEVLPKVFLHAQKAGNAPVGPPFSRYLEMDGDVCTMEGGVPVKARGAGHGEIEAVELPGGLAAHAVHAGAYERLPETYAAIEAWMKESGSSSGDAPWESYATDPADHPDPADWRTDVFWPLAR